MHGTTEDRTLLPEHRAETAELRAFLDRTPQAVEPALLRGPDGATHALPPEVYEALMVVVRALSEGKAVTVAPVNTTLTTQEAADLLGVSRPTGIVEAMAGTFPDGLVSGYEALMPAMANDPEDRHVLAAAVRGQHMPSSR
ncbi:helix-turn-helix domain-containing protein [Streptomyces sp. NBC_01433]|uniref:hypothetical protein n=1 Tax=Streptomyces sp. NBC_01433 TaxID=2903864 RepID=UPI002250D5A2|nr:hypothetical protein [Streptomyces sp. NBC_01433]MCX4675427.1 helix-turn-helix domain-containing protein [Streptomyces sp. NBC_01433]